MAEQIDHVDVEQNGAVEEPIEETTQVDDEFEFDFSKMSVEDAIALRKAGRGFKFGTQFDLIAPTIVNPSITIKPGREMPYKFTNKLGNEFYLAARDFEGELIPDIRFDVEDVTNADVQSWILAATVGNVETQIRLIETYRTHAKKPYDALRNLDYHTYLRVRNTFQEALKDLAKN